MLKSTKIRTVAALVAVSALAVTGVASAAAAPRAPGVTTTPRPVVSGTTVAEISAFPTGGKGSGTEATCALWTKELQADQRLADTAETVNQYKDAMSALEDDVDNALDAGCAVIF
jgi:hypothetical protein